MRGIEIQTESREDAAQRSLKKMAKKEGFLEISGYMVQAGAYEQSSMVTISRKRNLVICDYEGILGRVTIPLPRKKDIALIKLPQSLNN